MRLAPARSKPIPQDEEEDGVEKDIEEGDDEDDHIVQDESVDLVSGSYPTPASGECVFDPS